MPEGHTIHRLARDHTPLLVGRTVTASSPQGRFAQGAALLDGRRVERIDPYGKHLFYVFEGDALLHVHLGLYGSWTTSGLRAPSPPTIPTSRTPSPSASRAARWSAACCSAVRGSA